MSTPAEDRSKMEDLDAILERDRTRLVALLRHLGNDLRQRGDTLEQLSLGEACEVLVLLAMPIGQIADLVHKLDGCEDG